MPVIAVYVRDPSLRVPHQASRSQAMRQAQDMTDLMSDDLFESFMKTDRVAFIAAQAEGRDDTSAAIDESHAKDPPIVIGVLCR